MLSLIYLLVLGVSAYGFYHVIQVLRNGRLNFKPFNCAICLGFWYSLVCVILNEYKITSIVIATMFSVGIVDIFKAITEGLLRRSL